MTEQTECPICYEIIDDHVNVSISLCKHKFHTNCLLLCGSKCPLCRANLVQSTNTIHLPSITNTVYIPPRTNTVYLPPSTNTVYIPHSTNNNNQTAEPEAKMDCLSPFLLLLFILLLLLFYRVPFILLLPILLAS